MKKKIKEEVEEAMGNSTVARHVSGLSGPYIGIHIFGPSTSPNTVTCAFMASRDRKGSVVFGSPLTNPTRMCPN